MASKNAKSVLVKYARAKKEGTRDNAAGEATAAASPWFLGVGENLVVRK